MNVRLTLVSSSPRRAELLSRLGVSFDIFPSQVPERWVDVEGGELAKMNARLKVERSSFHGDPSRLLLGADTIIRAGELFLGKPAGSEAANRMLELLSGREHEVFTGVCLSGPAEMPGQPLIQVIAVARTTVRFRQLSTKEISQYIRSGEWKDKAGAYGVQGSAREFVEHLDGDLDNVIGLPVQLIHDILCQKFIHCSLC